MDIKNLKPTAGGRYKQGYYQLKNPLKYRGDKNKIIYRSSWELKFMMLLDLSSEITEWGSEPFPIRYFYPIDCKYHEYFVDFYFVRDGHKYLVEVKPTKDLTRPQKPKRMTKKAVASYNYQMNAFLKNYYKKIAADEFAKKNNCRYVYLTENSKL